MAHVLPRALDDWRVAYWPRPLDRSACAAMAEKYAALAALEALPTGPAQDAALRAAAARWPGCLRESQLAGPARCAERRALAEAGAREDPRPRADWRERGGTALVLWADLHPLLADQLRWRAAGGRGGVAGFCRFAAVDAGGRWPGPELLTAAAGAAVRPRQAYLWLAAQAGMPLPALNLALLGRPGHWDRRPGDPPGSA
jgi:hypothetical protein